LNPHLLTIAFKNPCNCDTRHWKIVLCPCFWTSKYTGGLIAPDFSEEKASGINLFKLSPEYVTGLAN
jgi:hypothetical protein